MANEKIRAAMRIADIKQWQVADAIGIHEATFCAWLRHELKGERKRRVVDAIKKVKEEKK